jgi:hypothetical protein
LKHGHLIELRAAGPLSADGCRSLARFVWRAEGVVPASLERQAAQLAEGAPDSPGRVNDLGRFVDETADETARRALCACLPERFVDALRPPLQWYACRGAGFHTDAHYSSVLFGAWYLAGPARDLAFAEPALQFACPIGGLVVFDPFQPHAVLDPGQNRYDRPRYVGAPASVFLGFELELTAAVSEHFGIGPAAAAAFLISTSTAVNAETGRLSR